MIKFSEIDKAWLAGFIDGEGYIGITFQRKKETQSSAASPRYHPYLIIANTNKDVLKIIKGMINDGKIYILNKGRGNNKLSYQYKLTKMDQLLEILGYVLPHLRIKDEQCIILINFIKRRNNIKPITGRGYRGVTSFTHEDEAIYRKLLSLSKRGVN